MDRPRPMHDRHRRLAVDDGTTHGSPPTGSGVSPGGYHGDMDSPARDPLSEAAMRNLAVAMQLRATAWELAAAGLRAFRPEWDEARVQAEVRAQFRRAAG